jgi:hypothetical protein
VWRLFHSRCPIQDHRKGGDKFAGRRAKVETTLIANARRVKESCSRVFGKWNPDYLWFF